MLVVVTMARLISKKCTNASEDGRNSANCRYRRVGRSADIQRKPIARNRYEYQRNLSKNSKSNFYIFFPKKQIHLVVELLLALTLTLKIQQQMNYWLLQELSHAKKGIKVGKCWTHLPKVQNIKGYWHWHWILRARARNMNYGEYFLGGSSIKCTALKTTAFP